MRESSRGNGAYRMVEPEQDEYILDGRLTIHDWFARGTFAAGWRMLQGRPQKRRREAALWLTLAARLG